MSSIRSRRLTDYTPNAKFEPYYLPIYPSPPTVYHLGVQLRLEHDRRLRKDGYVDFSPRPVPIEYLETCRTPLFQGPAEIGYFKLDEHNIAILREKSGCGFRNCASDSSSYPPLEEEEWGPSCPAAKEKAACSDIAVSLSLSTNGNDQMREEDSVTKMTTSGDPPAES